MVVPRSSLRRFLHLFLAGVLVWVQTVTGSLASARTPLASGDRGLADRAATFLRGIRQYRAALDATRFDPRVLGETFGADWRAAFRFVRDEIALLPYAGTLRFAAGTLVSRAGNACDRALLLAELLEAGGHRVRFARATLGERVIGRLLGNLDRPSTASSRPLAIDVYDPELLRLLGPAGLGEEEYRQVLEEGAATARALAEAVAVDAGFVGATLAAGLGPDWPPRPGRTDPAVLLAEHCWVQIETAEGWLDLDPSLPEMEPGDRLAEVGETVADLPPSLAPVLALRLDLLREEGGERRRATVLEAELPVGDAYETASLLIVPEVLQGERLVGPALAGRYADGFDAFVPMLVTGDGYRVGDPFAPDGRVLAKDFNARVAGAVGETVGGLFGGALGALGQVLDEPPPTVVEESRFAGLELRVEMRLPDGTVGSSRRLLVPPAPEEELRRLLPRTMDFLVTASRVSRELFTARLLDVFNRTRPLLRATFRGAAPDRLEDAVARFRLEPLQLLEFAHLRAVFAEYLAAAEYPELLVVPDGPLVVAYRRENVQRDGTVVERRGFDILFDRRLVLPREDGATSGTRRGELAASLGILDGVLEHHLADLAGGENLRSGLAALATAVRAEVPVRVLREAAELAELRDVPAYARGLMAEALREGRWILAPERPLPADDGPLFAFWRIDPRSGEVLALGATGAGQAMAEYTQQIKLVALGTLVSCVVTAAFGQFADTREFVYCLVLGMLIGVITAGAVGWMAKKFGWAASTQATAEGAVGGAAGVAAGKLTAGGTKPATPPPPSPDPFATPLPSAADGGLPGLSPGRFAAGTAPAGRGIPVARGGKSVARGGLIKIPPPPSAGTRRTPATVGGGTSATPGGSGIGRLATLGRAIGGAGSGTNPAPRTGTRPAAKATAAPKPQPGATAPAKTTAAPKPQPGASAAAKTAAVPKPQPGATAPAKTTAAPKPQPGASAAAKTAAVPKPQPGTTPAAKTATVPKSPAAGTSRPESATPGSRPAGSAPTKTVAAPKSPPPARAQPKPTASPKPRPGASAPARTASLPRPQPGGATPTRAAALPKPQMPGSGPTGTTAAPEPSPAGTTPAKTGASPKSQPSGTGAKPGAAGKKPPPERIPSELHGRKFELATPTPEPPPAGSQFGPSIRKIPHFKPLIEAVEATNLPWREVGKLKTLARAHAKVIITRKMNPHARRWYEQGAVGKDINMKGKSADRGAIAGLIPEDQAFSKLYNKVLKAETPEQRAAAWKEIAEYNAKVQKAVKEGGYEFVPFEVEGRKVGIYEREGKIYQAYEKDGQLYDATTRKAVGSPKDYRRIKDLRVVGKKVNGETRYVTADIDLDFVFENPAAPKQPVIEWQPETGDTLGNRTPREEALLQGFRNLAEAEGEPPKILHGAEQNNPFPEKLTAAEFPKLVTFSDGRVKAIKNPYEHWKLLRDLKADGYRVELTEEILNAYGWPENWAEQMPEAVRPWAPANDNRPRRRPPLRRRRRRSAPVPPRLAA